MRTFPFFVLGALLALGACSNPPPPAAPEPEPTASAPPPPPPVASAPPPAPACDGLNEKCVATDTSRMAIGKASVKPPKGWTYARETTASVAVAPGNDGFLVFTTALAETPDAELAAVNAMLALLAISDVKPTLLKTRLKTPQSTLTTGEQTPVKLWEIDRENHGGVDPKKDGHPGAALVAITHLADMTVVGVGFVPKTAPPTNVAAMLDAIKSLRGGK
jgi:hypothetical protein